MNGKDRIVLEKMIKYCEDSVKYIPGLDFDAFSSNELILTFSLFSLSQLGELVTKLSEEFRASHDKIPWKRWVKARP